MFSMINRGRIKDLAVVQEFEHLFGRLRGLFGQSFDADGNLIIADPNLAITPLGGIIPYAGAAAPTGWLLCNGAQVSRVTYQSLFNLIGTTYGAGDGSTTFNVPDLSQRFPLGKAASGTGATLGASGGNIDHTHTGGSHTHAITSGGSHSHGGATGSAGSHDHGGATSTEPNHTHTYSGTTDAPGSAALAAFGGDFSTVLGSAHTHGYSGTTSGAGGHNHSINTTAAHDHSVSADGSHDHGGATGASSGSTGAANPPYLALNYLIFAGV